MNCNECGGQLGLLGQLGNLVWFRCTGCGHEQMSTVEDAKDTCPEIFDEGSVIFG